MVDSSRADSSLKYRYSGLDLFRVVSALMICMFHTTIHLECNYGILQNVSLMGAVFMTAFFMLSGFSLFINWSEITLTDNQKIIKFWKKRALTILPIYWFTALVYILVMLAFKRETVIRTVLLLPIEILGLQSVFHTLFGVSHNGGTWFISCMMICYALYPYLQELVKHFAMRIKIMALIICTAILLYSPLITESFGIEGIYSNSFFRLLEFIIGILLASFKKEYDSNRRINIYTWWSVLLVFVMMLMGITIAVNKKIAIGNYMLYNWICLPCFMYILIGLSEIDSGVLNQSKVLKWLAGVSYSLFLAQLFSNDFCKALIRILEIENNLVRIFIGWSSCFVFAAGIHFFEIRIKRFIYNKLIESY